MPELNVAEWQNFLTTSDGANILQTGPWGELKAGFGWKTRRVSVGTTGAQILFRCLPFGLSVAYIPKGPVGPDWPAIWTEVDRICRKEKAIFLKVEPDYWAPFSDDFAVHRFPGFRPSGHTIQPPRTILVDLTGGEDTVLGRMKQKTRYNIRLAQKKEVLVTPTTDIATFHNLMQVTGKRDGFGVHSLEYYQQAYDLFHPVGLCELFLASYQGQPLAALMVFAWQKGSWYLFGASNDEERNRMPTYLLQWEAMRWAMNQGAQWYDLWGVPDEDEETLETDFTTRSDGLWGVYRFKRGFGGTVVRAAGAWDRIYNYPLYLFYRWWINRRTGLLG